MNYPLVSVVMPVYNVENFIDDAIDSILSQSYSNFEFIIINDGSTDHTLELIKKRFDNRIVLINRKRNAGNYACRNIGCKMAKGEYICVMDGDDIAMPNRIYKQVEIMEKDTSLMAIGSTFRLFNGKIRYKPIEYELIKICLLFNSMIFHPSMMIRKSALQQIGYYDELFQYASDYNLVCRLALHGKIINIPDILMQYRVHDNQISRAKKRDLIDSAHQIRLNYLQSCGFELSTIEQSLFSLLMSGVKPASNEKYIELITKMIHQNRTLNCFEASGFNAFLNFFITEEVTSGEYGDAEIIK